MVVATPRAIYKIPEQPLECEIEVKKSRFIASAAFAEDRVQALKTLERAKLKYPDARHHCWAYLIGNPYSPLTVAMSDDGEPGGTAGKPILNVLSHKSVGDIMLVVSRYFGGVKLGAGGLVRAYSSATENLMQQLSTVDKVPLSHCRLIGGYALEQPLRHWLSLHQGEVETVDYDINHTENSATAISLQVSIADQWLNDLKLFAQANLAEMLVD